LEAAIDLLKEVGYEALTMDAVAIHAKASKATMYRRWSGKAQMVVEAIKRIVAERDADFEFPDLGSLRADLIAGMQGFCDEDPADDLLLLSGLIHAMQRDAELAAIVRRELLHEDPSPLSRLYGRARQRGEVDGSAEAQDRLTLAQEIIDAVMLRRQLVTGKRIEPDFVVRFVDTAIMPLLADS
jgi:AcrR family transcriptional regulator